MILIPVEFCVLLEELFSAGIKGKCWRLIQNWYCNVSSQVKLGNHLSKLIQCIGRGIRQGICPVSNTFKPHSRPTAIVKLSGSSLGLSVNGLFLGAFAHADDIRTLASNLADAQKQVDAVHTFTKEKGFQLCV